jgi:hypothetical protein
MYNGCVSGYKNTGIYIELKGLYMKTSLETYDENGVKVTVYPTYAPRSNEKTFKATRYSVSNMGRKQVTMKNSGLKGLRK